MARALKGKTPEAITISRPKFLCYGRPGVGKTRLALDFPRCYYVDTEGGATQPEYVERLKNANGCYFGKEEGSQDFPTVIEEIKTLATIKHDYQTLIIDSFSRLYLNAAANAELRVGNDYGKDKKEAQRPTRQLMLWIERLNMNVVLICHAKDKWRRVGGELINDGATYDGWDKMEYDLDLVIEVTMANGERTGNIKKTRIAKFPLGQQFPWTYSEFATRCGPAIIAPAIAFDVATPEECSTIRQLLSCVKLDEDWQARVLAKAGVAEWEEMPGDKARTCIDYLRGLLPQMPPTGNAPAQRNGKAKHPVV